MRRRCAGWLLCVQCITFRHGRQDGSEACGQVTRAVHCDYIVRICDLLCSYQRRPRPFYSRRQLSRHVHARMIGLCALRHGPQRAGIDRGSIDLVALRAEKRALRKTLRSFETAFSEKHGRVVQTPADMQPRLQEYQRYKVRASAPTLCAHAAIQFLSTCAAGAADSVTGFAFRRPLSELRCAAVPSSASQSARWQELTMSSFHGGALASPRRADAACPCQPHYG